MVPAAFVTTQVKMDFRSSKVTVFNSKLLCRIAPFSKVDLKQTFSSAAGFFSISPPIHPRAAFRTAFKEIPLLSLTLRLSSAYLCWYSLLCLHYSVPAGSVFRELVIDQPVDECLVRFKICNCSTLKRQLLSCKAQSPRPIIHKYSTPLISSCKLETSGSCVVQALPRWASISTCSGPMIQGNPISATVAQKNVSKRKNKWFILSLKHHCQQILHLVIHL